jgi:hypothetical protein
MRGREGAAAVVLAVLLATGVGCGQQPGPTPAGTAPARTTSNPSTATATAASTGTPGPTDGNGSLVPPLPDLTRTPKASPRTATAHGQVIGADVSWPQCPKGMGIPQKRTEGRPMPTGAARFVVVGLTNGPSFVANPCIADQVAWVEERHLLAAAYSVLSYPDDATLARYRGIGPFPGATRLGGLRNVGYQAALFNVDTMHRAGLTTPVVWIDVEPVTHFDWSPDRQANAAVVQGMARGYRDAGFRIGFYSIGSLWTAVVGGLRFGAPEWRPAGPRGPAEALSRCATDWSFQGGPAILGQWLADGRDMNLTCPGAVTDPADWFHQY